MCLYDVHTDTILVVPLNVWRDTLLVLSSSSRKLELDKGFLERAHKSKYFNVYLDPQPRFDKHVNYIRGLCIRKHRSQGKSHAYINHKTSLQSHKSFGPPFLDYLLSSRGTKKNICIQIPFVLCSIAMELQT